LFLSYQAQVDHPDCADRTRHPRQLMSRVTLVD
jgi:hypothetical protein